MRPPYYAVIFTSLRTTKDEGYEVTATKMLELASQQCGYLGVETVRSANGEGITVSYWRDLESIRNWKIQSEHLLAQKKGKDVWYRSYKVRICQVKETYDFEY